MQRKRRLNNKDNYGYSNQSDSNNRTSCRFLIVDALNRPETLRYYVKNGFRYLINDERLEAKYMGIGGGRLPLNTWLMYFDLLKMKVNE